VRRPCPSCPWRLDQDAQAIPHFQLALAERLARTCPDERGMGPDFGASWFACHQSQPEQGIVCSGWLASVGHCHPGVRLAVARGDLDVEELAPGGDWPPLHASFQEVIAKLRATA